MSLINQMLRDLEARRAGNAKPNDLFDGIKSSYEVYDRRFSASFWLTIFFSCLALILLAGFAYNMLAHNNFFEKKTTAWENRSIMVAPHEHEASEETAVGAVAMIPPMTTVTGVTKAVHLPVTAANKAPQNLKHSMEALASMNHENFFASEEDADRVKTIVPVSIEERANIEFQQVEELIEQQSFPEAIAKLKSLLKFFPQYQQARLALAELLSKQENFSEALTILQAGLRDNPKSIEYVEALAHIFLKQGKKKEALATLSSAKPTLQENAEYYALMAGVYHQLGEYDHAIALYKKLLDHNPGNSIWWLGLANSFDQQGSNKAAIGAYRHAHDLYSLSPSLQSYVDSRLDSLGG
jgi:tetratricopeptide (TPR) repeat protein